MQRASISVGSSSFTNDLILQIFSHLDALSLTQARLVCEEWKSLSDSSSAWSLLCKAFWETKQNHPFERWVRVEEEEDSQDEIFRHQLEFLLLQALMEGQCHSQEIDAMLILLKFLRISSKKMRATPVSHWVRAQQIQLETELHSCSRTLEEMDLLKLRISANINRPATANEFQLKTLTEKGLLLSWRDSYIASIIDSSRSRITYEVMFEIFVRIKITEMSPGASFARRLVGDFIPVRTTKYYSFHKWGATNDLEYFFFRFSL